MTAPERPQHLRAFLVGVRAAGLQASRVVQQVKRQLGELVPSTEFVTLDRPKTTRRGDILCALQEWKRQAEAGIPHLFYYFGHGGRVRFADIPGGGDRVVHCLSCAPEDNGKERVLFLREISHHLGELEAACGNVSVILDSCYSGAFRAGEVLEANKTPSWARGALHAPREATLAAEGHPSLVRLLGASPRRKAVAADLEVRGQLISGIGLFTNLLLRQFEEAGADWWRMSWEMLAHALRQRVIFKTNNESQWLALGGPKERLLFSTVRARRIFAVGCGAFDDRHWIRAGQLTGAEQGDEWALVGPFVSDELEHAPLVRAKVDEVESNISRLAPLDLPEDGPDPVAAILLGVARRLPVHVDHVNTLEAGLPSTTWLTRGGPQSRHRLQVNEDEVRVIDRSGAWGSVGFPATDEGQRRALDLLEDRARVSRLLEHLGTLPSSPKLSPIEWTVGAEQANINLGTHVGPDSAIWVHLRHTDSESGNWFVSVVLIDAIGRPILLNASQPDGVEIDQDTEDYIGRRLGGARRGVVLDWPEGIIERGNGELKLVLLVSKRPIQLGHLVHTVPTSEFEALRMQGLELKPKRKKAPTYRSFRSRSARPGSQMVLSQGWATETFDLVLDPPRGAE